MWKRAHAALALAASVAACGDDGGEFPVEGVSGVPVAVRYPAWIPEVQAGVGAEDRRLLVDTGAPITICDRQSFPVFDKDGLHEVDWRGFGLRFPGYEVVSFDIFGEPPGGGVPDGLLGGDLLRHFALRLDYQGGTAALFFDETPPDGDDAIVVAGGPPVAFELVGGGLFSVPGDCAPDPTCGTFEIPATRVVLAARFEGRAETDWVLVDTGASALATSESFLLSLPGNGKTRPRLDGVSITTASGPAVAAMSRVTRVELPGDAGGPAVDDLPVLVLPTDDLLNSISDEVGRPIVALVGGSFLRRFQTTVDYPNERLVLERYRNPVHLPADEFVGVGFTLGGAGDGTYRVGDVYPGTDAATQGLTSGQVIETLAGTMITNLPRVSVDALFDGLTVGDSLAVGVVEAGGVVVKDVAVENLLPSYGAP